MYRTVSCDYAVMIIGETEYLLDSGETRTLSQGEVLIQRRRQAKRQPQTDGKQLSRCWSKKSKQEYLLRTRITYLQRRYIVCHLEMIFV